VGLAHSGRCSATLERPSQAPFDLIGSLRQGLLDPAEPNTSCPLSARKLFVHDRRRSARPTTEIRMVEPDSRSVIDVRRIFEQSADWMGTAFLCADRSAATDPIEKRIGCLMLPLLVGGPTGQHMGNTTFANSSLCPSIIVSQRDRKGRLTCTNVTDRWHPCRHQLPLRRRRRGLVDFTTTPR
jgi:hypothetical protein